MQWSALARRQALNRSSPPAACPSPRTSGPWSTIPRRYLYGLRHDAQGLGDDALKLSDAEVERRFEIKASKAVRELEEDIAQTA